MARQVLAALARGGHDVPVVSSLRAYLRDPADDAGHARIGDLAAAEVGRLQGEWADDPPDAFLCYHPYYKAPDLIGPPLCARFGLPYVTVESSYSARRNIGHWAAQQERVRAGAAQAAMNICLTRRDMAGLQAAIPGVRCLHVPPFIDTAPASPAPEAHHIVTTAMMRPGDKMDSFRHLAGALAGLDDLPWRLTVAGDGEMSGQVQALFAPFGPRVVFAGLLDAAAVARHLARGAVYAWPGCGEAYGLAYLEAQAAGLPVVAFGTAGVPEVVADGETGLLTAPGDDAALGAALRLLLTDDTLRARMADAARARVGQVHSMDAAAAAFDRVLRGVVA